MNYFSRLLLVWVGLCIGTLMAGFVFIFLLDAHAAPELKGLLEYVAVAVMVGATLGSKFLYQSAIQNALRKSITTQKGQAFLTAVVMQGAVLEGASIFAFAVYMLTKTLWVIGIGLAGWVMMLLQTPTRAKCIQDLQLSAEEAEALGKV